MNKNKVFVSKYVNQGLTGEARVPGDKSMSHRAVMFSSLAEGTSHISGLLEGDDVLATLAAFRAMGVQAEGPRNGELTIHGVGMHGLQAPRVDLDLGNSGTSMRLISGILAAQNFASKLIGDESLSARPMRRVTVPLTSMGARIVTDENGCPPIHIRKVESLQPIDYKLPIASAQIKSCVLLAGLYADGQTSVTEPAPTRDHTERMLGAYGYVCEVDRHDDEVCTVRVKGGGKLVAADIEVPADISSAAFLMVAASIVPASDITLLNVGVNPTRTGIISILRSMGASIELINQTRVGDEPVADIRIKYVGLKGTRVDPRQVPLAIDEFPVICIAAACAEGETIISGAEELRHKESDRISAMVEGLRAIGVEVEERKDGMTVSGGSIRGGQVQSFHDHRVAMSFAIAGAVAKESIQIENCDVVATSFPKFLELVNQLGLEVADRG